MSINDLAAMEIAAAVLLGTVCGVTALVLALRRWRGAAWVAVGAVVLGAASAAIGAAEFDQARHRADTLAAPSPYDSTSATWRTQEQRERYTIARVHVQRGLAGAVVPMVLGLVALGLVAARPPERRPHKWAVGGAALAALGLAASSGSLLVAPLPGPPIDPEDPAWSFLDAIEQVERGDLKHGCRRLAWPLDAWRTKQEVAAHRVAVEGSPFTPVPLPVDADAYERALTRCTEAQLEMALGLKDRKHKRANLEEIGREPCPFKPNTAQRARIDTALRSLADVTLDERVCRTCWGPVWFAMWGSCDPHVDQ